MTEQVSVEITANTAGLDAGAAKAKVDIEGVALAAKNSQSAFTSLGSSIKNMFSGLEQNAANSRRHFDEVHEASRRMADGLMQGRINARGLGVALTEAAEFCGPLAIGLGLVAVALVGAFVAKDVLEFGDGMSKMALETEKASQKLGMSTQQVQQWHGVADLAGISAKSMDMSMVRLERSMFRAANGGKAQSAVFKQLGIDITKVKSPSEAVLQIADKFKDMDNGPKKVAAAMQLMGRSGADMIPVLNQGRDGVKELGDESAKTGMIMDDKLVKEGVAIDEQFKLIHQTTTGLKNMFFDAFAPAIHAVAGGMLALGERMIASYKAGGAVKTMVDVLCWAFKAMITIMVDVISGVYSLWQVFSAAMVAIHDSVLAAANAVANLWAVVTGQKTIASVWDDFKKDAHSAVNNTVDHMNKAYKGVGQGTLKQMWSKEGFGKAGKDVPDSMDLDDGQDHSGKGKKAKKGPKDNSAKKALELALEDIKLRQEAAKDDYAEWERLEDMKLAKIKAFYGENSKEYKAELLNKMKFEKEHAKQMDELHKQSIEHTKKLAEIAANETKSLAAEKVVTEKRVLNELEAAGKISAQEKARREVGIVQEEIQNEIAFENEMWEIHKKASQDEMALMSLTPKEKKKINDDLEVAERQHTATMVEIQAKGANQIAAAQDTALQASVNHYESMMAPIQQGFQNLLDGMLAGTANFRQALLGIVDNIAKSFIASHLKTLFHHVAVEHAKTAATAAGTGMRSGLETAAGAKSVAISAASSLKQIVHAAAVAAANAYRAIAAIPVVGPFLAPAAAAVALGAVVAFGAKIASARGGMDIGAGENPLTQLHEKEMVLPAHIAEPLRNSLRNASGPSGGGLGGSAAAAGGEARSSTSLRGGDATFHYAPQYGGSEKGIAEMLDRDGRHMERWLQNKMRDGAFRQLGVAA